MSALLRFSTQTLSVLCFGAIISATLTYYIPKTQKDTERLHELINDNGGVAFFGNNAVNTSQNSDPNHESAVTTMAELAQAEVIVNRAPPHSDSQKFVKVSELGAFMKAARIVQKAFKMSDLKAATGLTEEQILKIESGQTIPTPDIANELETVLKVEVKFR